MHQFWLPCYNSGQPDLDTRIQTGFFLKNSKYYVITHASPVLLTIEYRYNVHLYKLSTLHGFLTRVTQIFSSGNLGDLQTVPSLL